MSKSCLGTWRVWWDSKQLRIKATKTPDGIPSAQPSHARTSTGELDESTHTVCTWRHFWCTCGAPPCHRRTRTEPRRPSSEQLTQISCSGIGDIDNETAEKRNCKLIRQVHKGPNTCQTPHSCVVDGNMATFLNQTMGKLPCPFCEHAQGKPNSWMLPSPTGAKKKVRQRAHETQKL